MTKGERIRRLLRDGIPYSKIIEQVGCSKGTISYHAKKIGLDIRRQPKYDWNEVQNYYDQGHSANETKRHFGFVNQTWWKAVQRGAIISRGSPPLIPLEQLGARASVRRRIISKNLLPYNCSECGLKEWRGKPLSLNLDHINGVADDHRLENLRWVCPNCDSQSPTFAGRNAKH